MCVSITSPATGGIFDEGSLLGFSAQVDDNEDLPSDLSIEWSLADGTILSTNASNSLGEVFFSNSTLPRGNHIITLNVSDQQGLSSSDFIELSVNGIPTIPSNACDDKKVD